MVVSSVKGGKAMQATDVLREEHEVILRVLAGVRELVRRLEAGEPVEADLVELVLEFITGFADGCHHRKEEDNLFPLLAKRGLPREGGPVAVMLREHELGRQLVRDMRDALAGLKQGDVAAAADLARAARSYHDLLQEHIDKENGVLFPMADRMLSKEDGRVLVERFEHVEREEVGSGEHERFLALVEEIERRLKPAG